MTRKYEKQSTKERYFILDERDEIAFTRILRETFPNIRFVDQKRLYTPEIEIHNWLSECNTDYVDAFVPEQDDWSPLILPSSLKGEFDLHLPQRYFRIRRSSWTWSTWDRKWAFDDPTLEDGYISGSYYCETGDDVRLFLNTVWRLLTKITVNVGSSWCGYSALRWAAKKPRRMLRGAISPLENWSFPEDCPYYRDELWNDDPPLDRKLAYCGNVPPDASTD
jgi:hypothetical protein